MFGDRVQLSMGIGPFTTDADATWVVGRAEGAFVVKSVDIFASASVATHATNYITFKLINLGTDGSGTTVIATASTSQTGGSAIAANTAFPLTVTAANATVGDNEVIGFFRDEANTNAATTADTVVHVKYIPVGATS